MRVFVTGATGYIGQGLVPVLVDAGHEVVALSRSAEKDGEVVKLGAEPIRGSLADPASYRDEAAQCEALVHAAFDYGPQGVEQDRSAIDTLLAAGKKGGAKSFLYTSGVWVLGACPEGADEKHATAHPLPRVAWRVAHEQRVLAARTGDFATAVLRPGLVYGGRGGLLVPTLEAAEKEGAATYIGDGKNRWPLIHRADLANLYRLMIELGAEGVFHGVDGASLPTSEIARSVAEAVTGKGKTRSVPAAEARKTLGGLVDALLLDQVVIGPRARELGWQPRLSSFAQGAMQAYTEWKA